jgi:Protein of unknown function (DUF2971)
MATIEAYAIPRHLYRYRSLKNFARELEAIKSRYLYCARYSEMNDPMEGLYAPSKLLKKSSDSNDVLDAIRSKKIRVGICSFSEVFDHELMWAHYANRFGGICIAYDFYKLRKYLPARVTFSRVYYNEEAPEVARSKRRRNLEETAKRILSYKNYRWLYEREWRMFANVGKVYYRNVHCIARVYIGANVDINQKRRIERLLKELSIPCQIQEIDAYGYEMSFSATGFKSTPQISRSPRIIGRPRQVA